MLESLIKFHFVEYFTIIQSDNSLTVGTTLGIMELSKLDIHNYYTITSIVWSHISGWAWGGNFQMTLADFTSIRGSELKTSSNLKTEVILIFEMCHW